MSRPRAGTGALWPRHPEPCPGRAPRVPPAPFSGLASGAPPPPCPQLTLAHTTCHPCPRCGPLCPCDPSLGTPKGHTFWGSLGVLPGGVSTERGCRRAGAVPQSLKEHTGERRTRPPPAPPRELGWLLAPPPALRLRFPVSLGLRPPDSGWMTSPNWPSWAASVPTQFTPSPVTTRANSSGARPDVLLWKPSSHLHWGQNPAQHHPSGPRASLTLTSPPAPTSDLRVYPSSHILLLAPTSFLFLTSPSA